jgi:hypothetical protein
MRSSEKKLIVFFDRRGVGRSGGPTARLSKKRDAVGVEES